MKPRKPLPDTPPPLAGERHFRISLPPNAGMPEKEALTTIEQLVPIIDLALKKNLRVSLVAQKDNTVRMEVTLPAGTHIDFTGQLQYGFRRGDPFKDSS